MRVLWTSLVAVAACRVTPIPGTDDTAGTDEAGVDDGTTTDAGGSDDGSVSGCRRVCFAWDDPPEQKRPPATPAPITVKDCNVNGYDPERCPDDFTCGDPVTTWYTETYAYTRPLCEAPADLDPVLLVASLPSPEPPDDAIPVTLVFSLLGEAWPSGAPGTAGTVRFDPVDDAVDPLTVDLPSDADGVLEVALVPGDYSVAFISAGSFDGETFPVVGRTGTLRVVREGEETIDVEAVPVPVRVQVNGERITSVPADVSSFVVTLWSPRTGSLSWYLTAGQALPVRVIVPPSTYDASLTTSSSEDDPTLPNGGVTFRELAEVAADGGDTLVLPVTVVDVSGTIRVDGAALPAGTSSNVRWSGARGEVWVPATRSGATSSYAGRVYDGRYDVLLDTRGDASDGLPRGTAVVGTDVQAGRLDIAATTTPAGGTVKVNGAQPTGSGRGSVLFVGDDGDTTELALTSSGAATFSGPAWSGRGSWVYDGGAYTPTSMPLVPMLLRSGVTPATGLTFDLDVESVTFTFTVDGQAVTTGGSYRGGVLVTRVDETGRPDPLPGVGVATAVYPFAASGGLVATGNLPAGTWQLDASPYGIASLPAGAVRLHDGLSVTGPVTRTFDRATLDLRVEVLVDEARPGDVAAAKHRGVVASGLTSAELPPTGRAVVDLRLWRGGSFDLTLTCVKDDGCASGLPTYLTLWSGLAVTGR